MKRPTPRRTISALWVRVSLIALILLGAWVVLVVQPSTGDAALDDSLGGPCSAMSRAMQSASSQEEVADIAKANGISTTIMVPTDFEASAILCWGQHDDIGNGAIEGVALINSQGSGIWLLFADQGTTDREYWEPILQSYGVSHAQRTEFGYTTGTSGAASEVDFWQAALDALSQK